MNRVCKRFLTKVAKGASAVAYALLSMLIPGAIAGSMGYSPEWGILIGAVVFLIIPMMVFAIREVYQDAKREVELENRYLMRDIKGDK